MTARWRIGLLVLGLACVGMAVLIGLGDAARFFQAYLIAYSLWLGLALGCLGLAMIQFLTGGRWGLVTRRVFEAGAATAPLMAVLFLPVLIGLPTLYEWTHAEAVAADPLLEHKQLYLNVPFFIVRAVIYFATWLVLTTLLRRWSLQQDTNPDLKLVRRLQRLSVIGLLVVPVTYSFAAIDWWMSLEPEWFSTMYPPLVCMVALLIAFGFAVLAITLLGGRPPLDAMVDPSLLNDLGSLLLAFLMLWAYMMFFQYMLIWAGNLTDEITWYTRRAEGNWMPVAWALAGVGFLLPFWLLLFRPLKRTRRRLGALAALVVLTQVVDVYWFIQPAFEPTGPRVTPTDLLLAVGLGSLWLVAFAWRLATAPLIAREDPRLHTALEHVHASA
jgi:hypothetical protein